MPVVTTSVGLSVLGIAVAGALVGICRHAPGDPNCSSNRPVYYSTSGTSSIDNTKYEVKQFEQVGNHLVLKVRYSSCPNCSYDGVKIMVFESTQATEVIFWKTIDPHFREQRSRSKTIAPPPIARSPRTRRGSGGNARSPLRALCKTSITGVYHVYSLATLRPLLAPAYPGM